MSKSTKPGCSLRGFVGDSSQLSCQLIATALRRGRYQAKVVSYATSADGIREGLKQNETHVAVIGARLEEGALAGLNVTRQLWASYPKLSVIVLPDTSSPTMVVEAFRAGASGSKSLSRGVPNEIGSLPVELKGELLRVEQAAPETGNGGFAIAY